MRARRTSPGVVLQIWRASVGGIGGWPKPGPCSRRRRWNFGPTCQRLRRSRWRESAICAGTHIYTWEMLPTRTFCDDCEAMMCTIPKSGASGWTPMREISASSPPRHALDPFTPCHRLGAGDLRAGPTSTSSQLSTRHRLRVNQEQLQLREPEQSPCAPLTRVETSSSIPYAALSIIRIVVAAAIKPRHRRHASSATRRPGCECHSARRRHPAARRSRKPPPSKPSATSGSEADARMKAPSMTSIKWGGVVVKAEGAPSGRLRVGTFLNQVRRVLPNDVHAQDLLRVPPE